MNKITWLVVLVIVAGAGYYFVTGMGKTVRVTLAEQNASQETGTAVLKEVNGTVEVTVTVVGQPGGVSQPAHIHKGTCAAIGEVLATLTFPKNDAAAVTVLEGTLAELKAMGPLAINVHKSVAESQKYVACGDIAF